MEDDIYREVDVSELQTDTAGEAVPESVEAVDTDTTEVVDETGDQPRDDKGQFASPRAEKRIAELTREREDAKRDAEYYRALAEQQQLVTQPTEPPVPMPVQVEATDAPKQEDFKDWEDYYAAVAKHEADKAVGRMQADQVEKQTLAAQQAQTNKFNERAAVFAREHPDFVEKVMQNHALTISNDMAAAIHSSDNGPEVAYYLASNPQLAQQIAMRPPMQQAVEIGRIHGLLSTAPRATATPPPVTPLKGSETAPTTWMNDPNISTDDWAKRRNKELAEQRQSDTRARR